jgi:hypothetical protein
MIDNGEEYEKHIGRAIRAAQGDECMYRLYDMIRSALPVLTSAAEGRVDSRAEKEQERVLLDIGESISVITASHCFDLPNARPELSRALTQAIVDGAIPHVKVEVTS